MIKGEEWVPAALIYNMDKTNMIFYAVQDGARCRLGKKRVRFCGSLIMG